MIDPQEEVLDDEGKEQGFLSHLYELRDRLLRSVLSIIVLFACLFPFSEEIYTWLADPLLSKLPEGASMIAIDVASPFLTPFKLVLMVAVFLAVPYLLSQIWGFVAPGLYKSEKRLAVPLLMSSIVLFYFGVAFAYYVVFPLVFGFFTSVAPVGIEISTDIARYLDFVITIFFAFGIAFEVPIAVFLLVAIGVTTPDDLAKKRPYFIVAAFIIGMFLTPPDVISQTMLALPMWVLFELGIIASRVMLRDSKDDSEPEPDPPDGAGSAPAPKPGPKSGPESGGSTGVAGTAVAVAGKAEPDDDYKEMTDEEMDAEMDRIEAAEKDHSDAGSDDSDDPGVGHEHESPGDTATEQEIRDELAGIAEEPDTVPEKSKLAAVIPGDTEDGQAAQGAKKVATVKKKKSSVKAARPRSKSAPVKSGDTVDGQTAQVAKKRAATRKITVRKKKVVKKAAQPRSKTTAAKLGDAEDGQAAQLATKRAAARKITTRKKKAVKKPVRTRPKTAAAKASEPSDSSAKDSDKK